MPSRGIRESFEGIRGVYLDRDSLDGNEVEHSDVELDGDALNSIITRAEEIMDSDGSIIRLVATRKAAEEILGSTDLSQVLQYSKRANAVLFKESETSTPVKAGRYFKLVRGARAAGRKLSPPGSGKR